MSSDQHRGKSSTVFDLFAGPGGWDIGAREVGIDPIGFEWDQAACDTRRAVGLRTMQCDVAEVDFASGFQDTRLWGLIASPPCQAWSMAGKGGGQRDKEHVVACALELAAGNDTRAEHAALCEDPRSILVVEPLRWALHFRPRWIAFEQVPPVLELWTLFAQLLHDVAGYSTWAGVLENGEPSERMIQAGAHVIQEFFGGDWKKYDGGSGLARLMFEAALRDEGVPVDEMEVTLFRGRIIEP